MLQVDILVSASIPLIEKFVVVLYKKMVGLLNHKLE